jgi:photosystem II stability/assembly factor-like uncharacterized protein
MSHSLSCNRELTRLYAACLRSRSSLFKLRIPSEGAVASLFSHAARGLVSIFFLSFISFTLQAQEWKRPIDIGGDYLAGNVFSVHFVDANTGWAVGSGGTIVHTTNGGGSWEAQTSGTTATLWSVHFVDANTGWAVGAGGTILHTTNGGANWAAQTSGTTDWLYSVHFVDANTGWAVGNGGTIRRTTNGGANWVAQTSGTTDWLWSVHFVDADTGWAVGENGTILRTTNGGVSWAAQTSGTTLALFRPFCGCQYRLGGG